MSTTLPVYAVDAIVANADPMPDGSSEAVFLDALATLLTFRSRTVGRAERVTDRACGRRFSAYHLVGLRESRRAGAPALLRYGRSQQSR